MKIFLTTQDVETGRCNTVGEMALEEFAAHVQHQMGKANIPTATGRSTSASDAPASEGDLDAGDMFQGKRPNETQS